MGQDLIDGKLEFAPGAQKPLGVQGSGALDPDQFSEVLGLASWLMSMSRSHRDLPISHLDTHILPGLFLKQFRLIRAKKMPAAFLTWATVSDEVANRLKGTADAPDLREWRSGPNVIVVDCVSPFTPADKVRDDFLAEVFRKSGSDNP